MLIVLRLLFFLDIPYRGSNIDLNIKIYKVSTLFFLFFFISSRSMTNYFNSLGIAKQVGVKIRVDFNFSLHVRLRERVP